jgi:hypothetical protein
VAKQTDCIKLRGGKSIHHAVRLSRSLGLEPNLLVTIKFWETSVSATETSAIFSQIRAKFGKWIQRPAKRFASFFAPPTFIWVIENPDDNGHLHAHWLVLVPTERQQDFVRKLDKWLASVGPVYSQQPIHIEPVKSLIGASKYMLKGQFKALARHYGIRHEYQGWVTGKRSGCSENIGPTQHARLCRAGKHPRPERWQPNKYRSQVV